MLPWAEYLRLASSLFPFLSPFAAAAVRALAEGLSLPTTVTSRDSCGGHSRSYACRPCLGETDHPDRARNIACVAVACRRGTPVAAHGIVDLEMLPTACVDNLPPVVRSENEANAVLNPGVGARVVSRLGVG